MEGMFSLLSKHMKSGHHQPASKNAIQWHFWWCVDSDPETIYRRVAEIQIFEKTYLIVIKDETGLKFKMNDSTLFLIGSYAQKLVASY